EHADRRQEGTTVVHREAKLGTCGQGEEHGDRTRQAKRREQGAGGADSGAQRTRMALCQQIAWRKQQEDTVMGRIKKFAELNEASKPSEKEAEKKAAEEKKQVEKKTKELMSLIGGITDSDSIFALYDKATELKKKSKK